MEGWEATWTCFYFEFFAVLNLFYREFMNFLMDVYTMENGKITECMVKDVLLIEMEIDGMVALLLLLFYRLKILL